MLAYGFLAGAMFPNTVCADKNTEKPAFKIGFETIKSYIRRHEGLSLKPTKCAAGIYAVGYGHCTKDTISSITVNQAEKLLDDDVWNAYMLAVKDGFFEAKAIAIAHFIYALGIGNWKKSTLRRLIKTGATKPEIEAEWLRWVHINGVKSAYLLDMRKQEFFWFNL